MRHKSDCALHNAPAYEPKPCDCNSEIEILKRRIKSLEVVIESQKEIIERQGNANEEKHNILCGIKEEIDEYFLKGQ